MRRVLRWHALAYAAVGGILLVTNLHGGGWWFFWPVFVWGIVLALHFFYVRSVDVDDQWVSERMGDLRFRSYDLGHVEDIKERVDKRDPSVRPSDERD